MQTSTSLFVAFVSLSLSSLATAVCTGSSYAIGSAQTSADGLTITYDIYDSSCNLSEANSFSTLAGVCDNQDFICAIGTKTISEYDDPVSGWAYTCVADTTAEACSSDTITYCCVPK